MPCEMNKAIQQMLLFDMKHIIISLTDNFLPYQRIIHSNSAYSPKFKALFTFLTSQGTPKYHGFC